MSLPKSFKTAESYFEECLDFFKEYQDLFNFSNTDILIHNVLDQIDAENVDKAEIIDKNFDLSRSDLNMFINNFFKKLQRLNITFEDSIEETANLESKIDAPLSPKKKHEIVYLAEEIREVCEHGQCEVVVDFGSGLGYLDQHIHETSKLKVLGLECNENHYVAAKQRQRKYHPNSLENVKYIKHTVSVNSDEHINGYLEEKFGNQGFCITGLHACADLTVDAINLFLKMADAKALVVMPCCYHKMASEDGKFKNFPLSECLRGYFEKCGGEGFLRVPFLRLATQPPSNNDCLEDLVFNLLARATLQLYAHKNNLKLKRKKRKAVRTKTLQNDFSNYLQNAINGFTLTRDYQPSGQGNKEDSREAEFDFEVVQSIWRETELLIVKAAIFVLLQNYLQPVAENFVLYDRLVYLRENGVINCCFKKIFSQNLSPRCLALVSVK